MKASNVLVITAGAVPLADVAVADGFNLPYRRASCDAVLCIAVLHHMSSPARRVRLLQELLRICRPGARLPPQPAMYHISYISHESVSSSTPNRNISSRRSGACSTQKIL